MNLSESWRAEVFGYVKPRMEDLSEEERSRYRSAYCGLCHVLEERFGQRCRFALTYDMTFLSLLLGALYEPAERRNSGRCAAHPLKSHDFVQTECTEYAADMTVMLVYHKCLDDWRDDGNVAARAYSLLLEKPYRDASSRHRRTCEAIEEGLASIGELEKAAAAGGEGASAPDAAANRFGALLGEVFAYRDDFWADSLRNLGARLGKFVYVMDAALDMDDDRSSGGYNPLVALDARSEHVQEGLQLLAADAAAAFEKLPLERDARVLRSVLYAGMWQKYQEKDKEKRRG